MVFSVRGAMQASIFAVFDGHGGYQATAQRRAA